ncbi:MAG: tRNA pseudouridine(13) synthase TruD [Planctomycetes bacterium]|nr:tRNA pseudouridine(13) synthase TruD [Planctomycetota bacterium]
MNRPFATADLPGVGGSVKLACEDFVVEEVPAYEPIGEGEHLFLWVEKRNITTRDLVERISQVTGAPVGDIGVAGLKDRVAVARQYVSLPARFAKTISAIEDDRVRILRQSRHRNKLRTGHLRGNRFDICVRGVTNDAGPRAERIAERIGRLGFPNYFGLQRFGRDRSTLELGLQLLAGGAANASAFRRRRRFLVRLALSAAQAFLFNAALADRIRDGLLHAVLVGDVMQVRQTGGVFVVVDGPAEQRRFDQRQTVVTGPMFGPKMRAAEGVVAAREGAVLDRYGLRPEDFACWRRLTAGTRRPYLVYPESLEIQSVSHSIRFRFTLPAGAYATALLREFLKQDV